MRDVKYTFRAFALSPFSNRERGTLTVCALDDHWYAHFDYTSIHERSECVTGEYLHMVTMDAQGMSQQFPEGDRDLGKVKVIGFTNSLKPGADIHSFELYNRLPVPPPGSTVNTAIARVEVKVKAQGA